MTEGVPRPGDLLAQRVRDLLGRHADVREVPMFGGLSFMVDGRLAVAAGRDGHLLVRTGSADYDDLLRRGAEPAVMGADRPMGRGWASVPPHRLDADEDLAGWLAVGLGSEGAAG